MDECQNAMEELHGIVEGIRKLRDTAYAYYSLLVEQVLKDQITDEQQLEKIMAVSYTHLTLPTILLV